jgi:hypothetical protein
MIRSRVVWTALMISVTAASVCTAQQGDGPSNPPTYADPVALERIRQALAAPRPHPLLVQPVTEPTFRVRVFGEKPFMPSFDEWLIAELADSVKAAKYRPQMSGVDLMPLVKALVANYRQHQAERAAERARKQVADELAEFLRTHPSKDR